MRVVLNVPVDPTLSDRPHTAHGRSQSFRWGQFCCLLIDPASPHSPARSVAWTVRCVEQGESHWTLRPSWMTPLLKFFSRPPAGKGPCRVLQPCSTGKTVQGVIELGLSLPQIMAQIDHSRLRRTPLHAGVEDALYEVLRCPGRCARIGGLRRMVQHMAVRCRSARSVSIVVGDPTV
jgi:hypothetical protein